MADHRQTIAALRERIAAVQSRHAQQSRRLSSLERQTKPALAPQTPPAPTAQIAAKPARRRKRCNKSKIQNLKSKLPKSGPGTELFTMYKSWGVTGCTACNKLRRVMDRWGVAGCRELQNFEFIINDLMRRAPHWWKTKRPWVRAKLWWQGNETILDALLVAGTAAVKRDLPAALRRQLEIHVNTAIAAAEAKEQKGATDGLGDLLAPPAAEAVSPAGGGVCPDVRERADAA